MYTRIINKNPLRIFQALTYRIIPHNASFSWHSHDRHGTRSSHHARHSRTLAKVRTGTIQDRAAIAQNRQRRLDLSTADGAFENVIEIDFASMYPSLMVTHNLSAETVLCACCQNTAVSEAGYNVCEKRRGLIPPHARTLDRTATETQANVESHQ